MIKNLGKKQLNIMKKDTQSDMELFIKNVINHWLDGKLVVIMEKYKLADYQWKQIEPLIPPKTSKCGKARLNLRELIDVIIWGY